MEKTVGIIGLGIMGGAIAHNLEPAIMKVSIWAATRDGLPPPTINFNQRALNDRSQEPLWPHSRT
jgi:3-hydroxyacyl-CoA dehydrogenase